MIYRNRMTPWHSFLIGMASVFDGLVSILTLGYLRSSLKFELCSWAFKQDIRSQAQSKVSGNPA